MAVNQVQKISRFELHEVCRKLFARCAPDAPSQVGAEGPAINKMNLLWAWPESS
jgi:hypothetical protein